jgi:hypothetical protein
MTMEADATCYIRDKDDTMVWSFPPKRTVHVLTSDADCILRSKDELLSDNGKYALVIEQNGSMYIRGPSMNDKKILWNVPVKYLTICNEGKIRLFDYNGKSTIYNGKSKLGGEAPFSLCCDDNGILRIYDGKEIVRGLPDNCERTDVFLANQIKNYLTNPYSSCRLPLDITRYLCSGQEDLFNPSYDWFVSHVIMDPFYRVYQRMRYTISCHLDTSSNTSNKIFSIVDNSAEKYRIELCTNSKLPHTLRRKCLLNVLSFVTFRASNPFHKYDRWYPFDVKDVVEGCSIKLSRVSN